MPSPARRALAVLVLLSLFTLAGLGAQWLAASTADPRLSVMDVRLGMTADEVRSRVDAHGPGDWTTDLVDGDWRLTHHAGTDVATFEIHEGQLVAVRVDAARTADLDGAPYRVTPGTVLVRETDGDRLRITLLSRACPTHHDEAEQLVATHVTEP